eukprot:11636077-Prorocentrum_lima.AAC.1
MTSSLVGSEMCIRDRRTRGFACGRRPARARTVAARCGPATRPPGARPCLLYTSDAAEICSV